MIPCFRNSFYVQKKKKSVHKNLNGDVIYGGWDCAVC